MAMDKVRALAVAGALLLAAGRLHADDTGILLLAHGGSANWNASVTELVRLVEAEHPVEVAFGMAQRPAIQGAVDRLAQRGVRQIVAVPLFISSHSSVFEATKYLLGGRKDAPPDLAVFARMRHGSGTAASDHSAGTRPITSTVPIRLSGALDHDPVVIDIVTSRAQAISSAPASEVLILVAHGPNSDEENLLWLKDMQVVVNGVRAAMPFARVDALTVRDDAPAPIKDAAAKELRNLVARVAGEERRALIVPLLLSYGGVEAGIRRRLEGLEYRMATQGLLPDERLARWISSAPQRP